jgi:DNA-directed RNA polymerase sigma subunit (sigma70/sigma32)
MRGRPVTDEALTRRALVGRLLQDETLSLSAIARQVELTRERVRQIRAKHFPDTPSRSEFRKWARR